MLTPEGVDRRRVSERDLVFVVFAICAALCNAFSVVAQHLASTAQAPDRGFVAVARRLVRSPLWWLGALALVGAFVFQALALHTGQLSIVQALLVTELVFALALRRIWIGQPISTAAWLSAALTCLSLAVFAYVAEPRGGHELPTSSAWLGAALTFGLLAGACVALAYRGSPTRRAALYGSASGLVWGIEAAFIKAATDSLTAYGVSGALQRWPIYAVVVGGISGTLLTQAALHAGPLSVSQPLMVALDPLASIVLGIWVFGEHFTNNPAEIAVGVGSFASMALGIVLLSRFSPPTLGPAARPSAVPATA